MDHILVDQLRALRCELASMATRMEREFSDVKAQLDRVEETAVRMRRDIADAAAARQRQQASINMRAPAGRSQ